MPFAVIPLLPCNNPPQLRLMLGVFGDVQEGALSAISIAEAGWTTSIKFRINSYGEVTYRPSAPYALGADIVVDNSRVKVAEGNGWAVFYIDFPSTNLTACGGGLTVQTAAARKATASTSPVPVLTGGLMDITVTVSMTNPSGSGAPPRTESQTIQIAHASF
jgi:hypothetical protein